MIQNEITIEENSANESSSSQEKENDKDFSEKPNIVVKIDDQIEPDDN